MVKGKRFFDSLLSFNPFFEDEGELLKSEDDFELEEKVDEKIAKDYDYYMEEEYDDKELENLMKDL